MIQNNNLSPLPFYRSTSEQNGKKRYAYGNIYPLYSPEGFILPFQIIREKNVDKSIHGVVLYDSNDKVIKDITSEMVGAGLHINSFSDFDLIIFSGLLPINIGEGKYFIEILEETGSFYSDVFTIADTSDMIKLSWWDDQPLQFPGGVIDYSNQYKNFVYLDSQIGKPEYTFSEEGETRDGYFFPEKQLSEKTYKFVFLAPEYMCDAMRIARLSDHITVQASGVMYECDSFLITPEWQTQGDIASVEAEFQTNTVVKKIGRGYLKTYKGDYNNDYNNDYKN